MCYKYLRATVITYTYDQCSSGLLSYNKNNIIRFLYGYGLFGLELGVGYFRISDILHTVVAGMEDNPDTLIPDTLISESI